MATLYPQFTPGQQGAVFTSIALGCIFGFLTTFWQEKVYR